MCQIKGICCTSLHNTHELSVHLCFVVFSSFPMAFWTFLIKRLIFWQIDFISYINWYRGWNQPLLVISQFSQFCVITAHISAERHLSKISYENFYSPWPPLTFRTIIIFHVKPFFTSAPRPTVKEEGLINYCGGYLSTIRKSSYLTCL